MLLTVTSTAAAGDRPRASCCTSTPTACSRSTCPSATAHVFYPEATPERCTVALLLEVDPVALVRGPGRDARTSTSTTARTPRRRCWRSRWARCSRPRADGPVRAAARPGGRAAAADDARAGGAVPRTGPTLVERLFEPLGWQVDAGRRAARSRGPRVGRRAVRRPHAHAGRSRSPTRSRTCTSCCPCSTTTKHYWVGPDEVDKLRARRAATGSPSTRSGARSRAATWPTSARTSTTRPPVLDDARRHARVDRGAGPGAARPLARRRREAVATALREVGARRVVDLGCGEGPCCATW